MQQRFTLLLAAVTLAGVLAALPAAHAHGGFNIPSPIDGNDHKAVRLVVGETDEPAFSDELHNIEIVLRDSLTGLPITNAYRDGVTDPSLPSFAQPQSLWVDAYFFPRGTEPAVIGADCTNTAKTKAGPEDGSYDCQGQGHTDSSTGQDVRGQHGRPGYYQADYQWYSEPGTTLYHVYGKINYYDDEMMPVSAWIDGSYGGPSQTVRFASNGVDDIGAGFGGFGLKHRADWFWPGAEYPDSVRSGMAEIIKKLDQIAANQTGGN